MKTCYIFKKKPTNLYILCKYFYILKNAHVFRHIHIGVRWWRNCVFFLHFLNAWYMWYIYLIEFIPSLEEAITSTYRLAFKGQSSCCFSIVTRSKLRTVLISCILFKSKVKAKENIMIITLALIFLMTFCFFNYYLTDMILMKKCWLS